MDVGPWEPADSARSPVTETALRYAPSSLNRSPSPISQTAPSVYLGTADLRLLNITKAKIITHKRDNTVSTYICCWEFSQKLSVGWSLSHLWSPLA